jgi:hypothetical protein
MRHAGWCEISKVQQKLKMRIVSMEERSMAAWNCGPVEVPHASSTCVQVGVKGARYNEGWRTVSLELLECRYRRNDGRAFV